MNNISNVTISAGPLTAFNALIAAKVRGKHFSDGMNGLSWMQASSFADPDSAPRGQNNPNYTAGVTIDDLDPTCVLGIATALGVFRNDLPSVAYTRHIVGMQALTAISPQLATFWKEYTILAQKAIKAQESIMAGTVSHVDEYRDVQYHDGAITEFLLATGDIYGPEINYPRGERIDVRRIWTVVNEMLLPYLKSFDFEGFKAGNTLASQSLGIGTTPGTGSELAFLSASTFDMLRSPWARILTNPAAFEINRTAFESRIQAALDTRGTTATADAVMFQLTESRGSLWLPLDATKSASENAGIIHASAMARPSLTTSMYVADDLVAVTGDKWRNQLYTKGDLVEAIFVDETVDVLTPSTLSVILDTLEIEEYEYNGLVQKGVFIGNSHRGAYDSGPLCSISPVNKATINVLCGTTLANFSISGGQYGDIKTSIHESRAGQVVLPNGTLTMGDVASTTVLSWYSFMQYLNDALPNDLRILMSRAKKSMRTLPSLGNASLRDSQSVLAQMVTSGVRDGYLAPINLAFNIVRPGRSEQNGPLLTNTSYSELFPQGGSVTPCLVTRAGGWDVVENTSSMSFVDPLGSTIRVKALPGRFVGSWDAGRYAQYLPGLFPASLISGDNTPSIIASNMCMWPGVRPAGGNYTPMHLLEGEGYSTPFSTIAQTLDTQAELSVFYDMADAEAVTRATVAWENQHPIHGFMRGLAAYTPAAVADPDNNARVKHTLVNRTRATRVALGSEWDAVKTSRMGAVVDMEGTHVSSPIAGGLMKAEVTTDDGPGAFYMKHLWDINRINCIGLGNYRWKGQGMSTRKEILPHPYATEPVSNWTWTMTLEDINTAQDEITSRERRIHAYVVMSKGASGLPSTTIMQKTVPVLGATTYAHDGDEGRIESLDGCGSGAYVIGGSDRWGARVAGRLMTVGALNGGPKDSTGAIFDPTNVASAAAQANRHENFSALNPIQASFVVDSGIGATDNVFTVRGVNATDDVDIAAIAWPMYDGVVDYMVPGPLRLEGETSIMVGDAFKTANFGDGSPFTTVIVDGVGLAPRKDLITANLLEVSPWLSHSYTQDKKTTTNDFSGPTPPGFDVDGATFNLAGERIGKVGHSQTVWSTSAALWRAPQILTNLPVNPWFSASSNLTLLEEKARREGLENPWIRGEGESGILHLRYEPQDIPAKTRVLQSRAMEISRKLTEGLTTSLFMELQIAN